MISVTQINKIAINDSYVTIQICDLKLDMRKLNKLETICHIKLNLL